MPKKPELSIVSPVTTVISPPRKLGKHGRALWDAIQAEYGISDRAGIELLAQACEELEQIEGLTEEISRDGRVIRSRNGVRAHPAIRDVRQGRAVFAKLLKELGVTIESLKTMGRPAQGLGWIPERGNNADDQDAC
jgi:P27 family predicted phage terminase small subunit